MNAAQAFVLRDFRVAWSYRFSFAVQNVGLIFSLFGLKFFSEMMGGSSASLARYGGNYFAFALPGVALTTLSYPAVKVFRDGVRSAQVTGTFEAMLLTRTRPSALVLCAGIYPILGACVEMLLIVAAGGLFLGAALRPGGYLLALVVVAMTVAAFVGIGLISAAFAIAFKQGEPFTGGFVTLSLILGGVLYPVSVLPGWLRALSPLLPVTHALELLRNVLIEGAHVGALAEHLAALALFTLLLPIGLLLLDLSMNRARRTGSLSHY